MFLVGTFEWFRISFYALSVRNLPFFTKGFGLLFGGWTVLLGFIQLRSIRNHRFFSTSVRVFVLPQSSFVLALSNRLWPLQIGRVFGLISVLWSPSSFSLSHIRGHHLGFCV